MRALAILVGIVILLAALWAASSIVVPLLIAITIAVGFQPLTLRLEARGVPAIVASILTIAIVLAVIVGLGALVVLAARDLATDAPRYADELDRLRAWALDWLDDRGLHSVSDSVEKLDVGEQATGLAQDAVVYTSGIVGDLFNVILLTVFIQVEAGLIYRKLDLILARPSMQRAVEALGEIQRYLRIKSGLAVANGVLLGGWCWVWDVSNPLLWGVLAAALNFLPFFGSVVSALPPVLLTLVDRGVGPALGVTSGYVAVNIVVDNILEPRLMGRTMGLSPLVLLVSLLVWGLVLGPIGALLSVPITVAVRIYLDFHPQTRWIGLLLAAGTRGYDDLRGTPPEPDQDASAGPT